ncbi:hypothetical protein SAMN02910357_01725 [Succinivibrio dextrinosolvens]|uniref:zinc ribbon domain-containing protein n=1 Tax=Succinivibrio dextrinosolvens TaxID=83771 RepID=UPI0008E86726|nr:zinc ribbon domain-containing protein [Succinivibrio dextrinosolvens]SFS76804.1 hypothetical protein SAMN02910357_01725 [Succinivibrio dextrinosolvens]
MKCKYCGCELPAVAKFCKECGQKVETSEDTTIDNSDYLSNDLSSSEEYEDPTEVFARSLEQFITTIDLLRENKLELTKEMKDSLLSGWDIVEKYCDDLPSEYVSFIEELRKSKNVESENAPKQFDIENISFKKEKVLFVPGLSQDNTVAAISFFNNQLYVAELNGDIFCSSESSDYSTWVKIFSSDSIHTTKFVKTNNVLVGIGYYSGFVIISPDNSYRSFTSSDLISVGYISDNEVILAKINEIKREFLVKTGVIFDSNDTAYVPHLKLSKYDLDSTSEDLYTSQDSYTKWGVLDVYIDAEKNRTIFILIDIRDIKKEGRITVDTKILVGDTHSSNYVEVLQEQNAKNFEYSSYYNIDSMHSKISKIHDKYYFLTREYLYESENGDVWNKVCSFPPYEDILFNRNAYYFNLDTLVETEILPIRNLLLICGSGQTILVDPQKSKFQEINIDSQFKSKVNSKFCSNGKNRLVVCGYEYPLTLFSY